MYLVPQLDVPNAVEAVAEDLAVGASRVFGPRHPAAEPRHALNTFVWQAPSRLPASAPASGLTREFHSFSRIFTGVLYDLVRRLFRSGPGRDEAALAAAAADGGPPLHRGRGGGHPDTPLLRGRRRRDDPGRPDVLRRAHRPALGEALEAHGLAPATRMAIPEVFPAPPRRRAVELGDLDPRLAGCVAFATEPAAASVLPESTGGDDEVKAFVATLLAHDRIAFNGPASVRRIEATATAAPAACPTHVLRPGKDGRQVLTRIRFV